MPGADLPTPTLDQLASAVRAFGAKPRPDASMARLHAPTGDRIDLGDGQHRDAVHRWLNAWGCRLAYNGAATLSESLATWHHEWAGSCRRRGARSLT